MTLIWRPGYITTFADPDVQSYLTRVEETDNQRLEYPVAVAIDEFTRGCKADGIWAAIKASCILAGARTLNGALVPLMGTAPTNFNFVAGDYNRKTGLVGNGSTKYLDSNRNNNADPQNSNHNAVFLTTTGPHIYMGSGTELEGTNALGNGLSRNRSGASSGVGGLGALGFNGMERSAAASYTVRAAGANNTIGIASLGPGSSNIYVFCRHTSGSPNALTDARIAFYSIGESLDLALLDARITTLINRFAVVIP